MFEGVPPVPVVPRAVERNIEFTIFVVLSAGL